MTGDGVSPPRMRVPVTVTAGRSVVAGVVDVPAGFLGCFPAGASVIGALPCAAVSLVASWAAARSLAPEAATSKAIEMALRSVLVFMLRPLLSPWVDPLLVPVQSCPRAGTVWPGR